MPDVWKKTKLLPRFYQKLAQSFIDAAPCPRIKKFRFGFGLVDESGPEPVLLAIPSDMEEIPGVFFEGFPEGAASEGRALFKCELPTGGVAAATRFSLVGLYDQEDELVAVCLTLPDWITPDEAYAAHPFIDFPVEGS